MMWQVAGGIIIGGLVLAFLLRTRAGWYVMLGTAGAAIIGGLWGLLVLALLADKKSPSETERLLYLLTIPLATLAASIWTPRFALHFRDFRSDGKELGFSVKLASNNAFEEAMSGVVAIVYLGALLGGPFVWGYGPEPFAGWAKVATIGSWGIVALFGAFKLFENLSAKKGTTQ